MLARVHFAVEPLASLRARFYARKRAIEDFLLMVLVIAAGLLVFLFLPGWADKLLKWAAEGFRLLLM